MKSCSLIQITKF